MTEEKLRKIVIGSMLIMCVALVFGIVKLNLKYAKERQEAHLSEPEMIEEPMEKIENKDIEKEKKKLNIPPIEKPKEVEKDEKDDNVDNKEEEVEKEVYQEIEGEKVPVRPIPTPQTKNLPEGMENPTKPSNVEAANDKGNTLDQDDKNDKNDKPKKEEKPSAPKKEPEVIKGGTGSDGVLRDLSGNPIKIEGNPNAKVEEVKGSNYGDGEWGTGDKF